MRVLVIDTGRGHRYHYFAQLRQRLAMRADDELIVLAAQPPAEPLPVTDHLVVLGPLRGTYRPRPADADYHPAESDPANGDEASDLSQDPSRDVPEEVTASVEPPRPGVARAVLTRGRNSVQRRLSNQGSRPARAAARIVRATRLQQATSFAVMAGMRSAVVELAASCDVVVAHDTRSLKAAWWLARLTADPVIVAGVPAGRAAVEAWHNAANQWTQAQ